MKYRIADISDYERLTELRLNMRKERDATFPEEPLQKNTLQFFQKNIANGNHVAFVCESNGEIIATAGLTLFEMPPTDKLINRKVAKLMNMYTVPEFRRKGVGRGLLGFVLAYARKHEYYKIMLNSSPMGKSLYESAGFTLVHNEYEYSFNSCTLPQTD